MNGLQMKYFVLTPGKDDAYGHASRAAMREYAFIMTGVNPALSRDIYRWVGHSEQEHVDRQAQNTG